MGHPWYHCFSKLCSQNYLVYLLIVIPDGTHSLVLERQKWEKEGEGNISIDGSFKMLIYLGAVSTTRLGPSKMK